MKFHVADAIADSYIQGAMRTSEIEKQRSQRPFVPFWLCFSDGREYEVRHPVTLIVSRTVLAAAVHKQRSRQPEGVVLCDPAHVVRLEPSDKGGTKAASGRKR